MLRRPARPSKDTPRLLTRRNVLIALGTGFALLTIPRLLPDTTHKKNTTRGTELTPPLSSARQYQFLELSKLLTARQHLSPQFSARMYMALSDQSQQFQQQAGALFQFVKAHQISDVDTLLSVLKAIKNKAEQTQLITVMEQIISAWYLGTVGEGSHAKTIAFGSALMFDQVRDVLAVPGHCPAARGYWATPPSI